MKDKWGEKRRESGEKINVGRRKGGEKRRTKDGGREDGGESGSREKDDGDKSFICLF